MLNLIKPPRLQAGDKVAAVSLSWGGAGDPQTLWRYEQGKRRLQEVFGLQVVEMPYTLAGSDFVYRHPELRAADWMEAFSDPSIKGIFSCIGGNDSARLLPYIDFDLIRRNPKVFIGYSDTTALHFMCLKAGLSSFYGPAILSDFAENVSLPAYTRNAVAKALFCSEPIGRVEPSPVYTGQYLAWEEKNKDTARVFSQNTGYELLQGSGTAQGPLIGGCLETLETLKGTAIFPAVECFDKAILFLETSECKPPVWFVEDALRNLGVAGILNRLSGLFFGKPMSGHLYGEYAAMIQKVLKEFGLENLPVLLNGSFGHNEPKTVLPYGAVARIDCNDASFSILDAGTANRD